MNPRVTAVEAQPDFALSLTFSDGSRRRMDLRPYLDIPVFRRLRDPAFFARARACHGTVVWPGGIDFDPDTLYLDSTPTEPRAPA
jgi:hypothetical protein